MSVVTNISHPTKAASDELVPSRYSLRVGDIEVLVISDGVFSLSASTLATNVEPADLSAWLTARLESVDEYKWPLNVVVVRSGDRTVLIDSGVGEEFPDAPRVGKLIARLDAAGIDPASITDVVITHLHVDHVGGLLSEGLRSRLRPNVPIHLAAAEVAFWTSPDFSQNTFGGFPDVLESAESRFVDMYRGQLRPFETEFEVAPGVVACCVGGHTRGHSVVHIASGGDRLTFLGDSVFENHFDHPDWHNAFDHDPEEAVRVRLALLRKLAASGESVLAAHLPFPSVGRVAVNGDVFRWIPTPWDY
ncbi:MBL fold metallo-hydrolase [Dyella flagellata]|uniref:MBL fold metallo-hydrolase n=1 Tax=Dyella flagellata TaxID=1867833 RepID=A0ABQ5XGZ6_9GAMM|nr:MBL fold metallo-hydrolase [Dyella flagellata]GLQ90832.1 MBL fold metallo-hydrolase [Dyella flagellata]